MYFRPVHQPKFHCVHLLKDPYQRRLAEFARPGEIYKFLREVTIFKIHVLPHLSRMSYAHQSSRACIENWLLTQIVVGNAFAILCFHKRFSLCVNYHPSAIISLSVCHRYHGRPPLIHFSWEFLGWQPVFTEQCLKGYCIDSG